MEFLIFLAIPTAIVWGMIAARLWFKTDVSLLPLMGVAVLLTGTLVGHDFFHFNIGPLPVTIDRAVLGGLAVLFTVQFLREKERVHRFGSFDWLIVLTLGFLAWNVLTHDWRFKNNLPLTRLLFFYFLPIALFFLMRSIKLDSKDLKIISLAIIALALFLSFTAMAEVNGLKSLVFPKYVMNPGEFLGRGRGPLLNPVINGMLMTLGACCLAIWWPGRSLSGRLLLLALCGFIGMGVFCTYTRSVWIGFAACCVLFFWYPANIKLKAVMWIAGILLLVISLPAVGHKLFSFKRDQNVSQAEMEMSARLRPMFLEVAWLMFQDRPILGCGFGQYSREKDSYLKDAHTEQPLTMTRVYLQHNVFLAFLTETGIVGVGLLSALLSLMAWQSWKLWRNEQMEWIHRIHGLVMLGVLIAYAINGMFHDVSIIPMSNLMMFFYFGLVSNLSTSIAETSLENHRTAIFTRPAGQSVGSRVGSSKVGGTGSFGEHVDGYVDAGGAWGQP